MASLRGSVPVVVLGIAGAAEALVVFGLDATRPLLVAVLAVPLLWRRSHPSVAVLLITSAFVVQLPWESARLFDQTFVGFVCMVVAAYSVGRHGAGSSARLVGAGAAAAGGLVIGLTDGSVMSGLLAAGILGAPIWVGQSVRERVTARTALADQAHEIAASTPVVAQARALQARELVAAEIQRSLVGRVSSMLVDTERAQESLSTGSVVAAGEIAEVESQGRDALRDMRRTLGVLRDVDSNALWDPPRDGPEPPPGGWPPGPWLPVGVLGYAATEALVLAAPDGGSAMLASALLAAAMAAPLLLRRSRAVSAAVLSWGVACALVSLLTVTTSMLVVGMLFAGAAGGAKNPARRFAGLFVALLGVVAVSIVGELSGPGDYVFPAVLMSMAWLGGSAMRHQAGLLSEIEVQAEEVRRLRDIRASVAATNERLRLARDLHDVVAHHLMVMVVQAGAARRTVESGRPGAADALEAVRSTGDETLAELGVLLDLVDPATRESRPTHGMGDLEKLVDRVRASGLEVELRVDGARQSLPGGLDMVAHRIVQESLTNVIRHADASRAQVRVVYLRDRLTLEIVDDGRGMRPGTQAGLGVTGMRERAQLYGGHCEVTESASGGVRVSATLPLELVGAPG